MVSCPKCGKPLVRGGKRHSRYYCETEDCPVIFVKCPHEPFRTKIACTSLTDEKTLEKVTVESSSHVF